MVALRENLSESFPATRSAIRLARLSVTEFAANAGAEPDQLDAIRLAVSEAVTNAVVHAYQGEPGEVHVTAALAGGELWVLVADDGCGFQTPARTPGLGCGLPLITETCEQFAIAERADGGTEVRMRFRIGEDRARA